MDRLRDLWDWLVDKFLDFKDYLHDHKKARILFWIAVVFVGIGVVQGYQAHQKAVARNEAINRKAEQRAAKYASKPANNDASGKPQTVANFDSDQKELIQKYGKAKKGYIWDQDGNLVAFGDKSMKARDVGRVFMQAVSKLDAIQMQKYAYPSTISNNLDKYYNSDEEYSDSDTFKMDTYKQALKSLQVLGTEDEIPTANNKLVITYKCRYLDLSYKDFWRKDKDKLFNDMQKTTDREHDQQKIMNYLYRYIDNYYQNGHPSMTDGDITIVLQKSAYAGWIVTNDSAVDNIGKFEDDDPENSAASVIEDEFESWYDNQEGKKPNFSNSNIDNDQDDSNGKSTKYSTSNSNGNKDLQGNKGSDDTSPFKE